MPHTQPLSPNVSVGPQLSVRDIPLLALDGFGSIINNRPDDESPDQPPSASLEAAAHLAGLRYLHLPVTGLPEHATVSIAADRLKADAAAGLKTVMFCRSGMRSAATWAMAQSLDGAQADDLRAAASNIGYDLSRLPL